MSIIKRFCYLLLLLAISLANTDADTLWDYQRVNLSGFGIHPLVNQSTDPSNRVVVEGVALAGWRDILETNIIPPAIGQYTIFLQDDQNTRGGIQAWRGSFYYAGNWPPLDQNGNPMNIPFEEGDRIRITGLLSDMGRGKVVINDRHNPAPEYGFQVEVITGPMQRKLPDPELIPSISNCNYFDSTLLDPLNPFDPLSNYPARNSGGERWQTRYVMLHGVQQTAGAWSNGSMTTISDDSGSVGMLLSAMGDFNSYPPPTGKLSVVGIFDQEDTSSPHTENYRIWVKKRSDIAKALSSCRQVRNESVGERVALISKVVSRVFDGYFYTQDQNRSGGVRVISTRQVQPGDVVHVHGPISLLNGVKSVNANKPAGDGYLTVQSNGLPPVPFSVQALTFKNDAEGFLPLGLLVTITGRVGQHKGGSVYELRLEDYNPSAPSPHTILFNADGQVVPDIDSVVTITGICELDENGERPFIQVNSADTIVVNN